jgi:hypothetical protein
MVIVFFFFSYICVCRMGRPAKQYKNSHSPTEIQSKRETCHSTLAPNCSPKHGKEKNEQTLEPTYSPVNPGLFHVRAAASLPYEHVDYAFVHRFGRTAAQLTFALRL